MTCPAVSTVGNLNGSLDPGEAITCTASYSITQADLNSGSVTNVATAHAGGTNSNQDTETVTAVKSPALTLVKSATPATYSAAGQTISYSYLVTNSGNVSLAGPVTVTDDKATVDLPGREHGRQPERQLSIRVSRSPAPRRTRSRRPT